MELYFLYGSVIIDFMAGLLLGIFGHFFSILCFPFLALIRAGASLSLLSHHKITFIRKHALFSAISGALGFYLGIMTGIILLILVLVPRVAVLRSSQLGSIYQSPTAMIGGMAGGMFCGIFYMLFYVLIAYGAVIVFKTIKKHK